MAYLKNAAVNLLNLHYGLHALALYGAGAFFVVYLLKSGVSVPLAFGAIALVLAGRFLVRPLVLVLAPRYGLRPLVAFGTILGGLQYLFLAEVRGADWMLFGFCVSAAVSDAFYWTCYHAYFARLGDSEHRGHQVGAREALAALAGIVGPLFVAWCLTVLGPGAAFGSAAAIHVLAALPFLGTPDVAVARAAPGAFRAALPGVLLFAADGWIAAGYYFAWQIALFLSLGESYSAFGGALALSALAGAVAGLFLGRQIDAGYGGRAVWLAFASVAAVTLIRAMSTQSVVLAVAANAMGAVVACLYIPTLMTAVYNQAKRSPCTLRFHLATEGGWDAGGTAGCLACAGLAAVGLPLWTAILLSMLGLMLSVIVLRQHYRDANSNGSREVMPGLLFEQELP
jgi:DHA1 family inner membrane transport protein